MTRRLAMVLGALAVTAPFRAAGQPVQSAVSQEGI